MAGGEYDSSLRTSSVEYFDVALNKWTNDQSMPSTLAFNGWAFMASSAGSSPNGKPVMYVAGGLLCDQSSCFVTSLVAYFNPSASVQNGFHPDFPVYHHVL